MLISEAFAQGAAAVPEGPNPLWNLGMLAIMVLMFYLLLIRPQQKRFKEHGNMLSALEKGDKVVTGGGLVGVVEKAVGDDQLVINLGGGVKVTAMRSTITGKASEDTKLAQPANDKPKKAPAKKKAATAKKK